MPVDELSRAVARLAEPLADWLEKQASYMAPHETVRRQENAVTPPALTFARLVNKGARRP